MTPRTAVVTAGTGGLGLVVASALASAGDRLLVTGRDQQRGGAAEDDLRGAGAADATFLPTDHADLDATRHLVSRCVQPCPAWTFWCSMPVPCH